MITRRRFLELSAAGITLAAHPSLSQAAAASKGDPLLE
jgi:hypothetical protein